MDHRPYPRIQTSAPDRASGSNWVATEKVHGANLVVATDGSAVRIGKRKAWLEDDEAFFGWQLLRPSLAAAAVAAWRALGASTPVRLHGELYGGAYPHPAVAQVPGNSPVQTGIWYSPEVRFSLFDVQVERQGEPVFLAHRALEDLAAHVRLEAVPVLARGSRSTLDALPLRYPTRVPSLHGLPPIEGNMAEGFVLKPDAEMPVALRAAVKRKIPEFDDARFDDGAAWNPDAHLAADALAARGTSLVNAARLASARSKVGPSDLVALCEEVALDVMVDLEAVFPRAFAALREDEVEALRAALLREARTLLAP